MRRHYFVKEGAPVWIHVPGTPFTLPGERPRYERLPGMVDWAPREAVERVGRGLKEDVPIEALAEQEAQRGLLTNILKGGGGGAIAGSMGARLVGGEKATAPIKQIYKKGLSRKALASLSKLPRLAKVLPLLGMGAGLAGGIGSWAAGREGRREEAQSISKGLLSEQILQEHALNQARQSLQQRPLLMRRPPESARVSAPKAVVLSTTGV